MSTLGTGLACVLRDFPVSGLVPFAIEVVPNVGGNGTEKATIKAVDPSPSYVEALAISGF